MSIWAQIMTPVKNGSVKQTVVFWWRVEEGQWMLWLFHVELCCIFELSQFVNSIILPASAQLNPICMTVLQF